jgi:uncharacterized protein DUF6968
MPHTYDIDEVIASRTLLIGEGNHLKNVEVKIGKPRHNEGEYGFSCSFQVVGIGSGDVKVGKGLDGVHSLQSAMLLLGETLRYYQQNLDNSLRWDGSDEGDLGFPTIIQQPRA